MAAVPYPSINPLPSRAWGTNSITPGAEIQPVAILVSRYFHSVKDNLTQAYGAEHHIAKISSADHAFVVASGMAALDIILRMLKPGDEVIAGDDLYGGTNRLLSYIRTHVGVTIHHVDTTDPNSLSAFIHPEKTAMVLLESPTNPLLKIVDLATISKDVKERAPNAVVVVDNTMMSPYLQRPLEHGADIVYDSATKYLSGHHDLMAGVIVCNRDDLAKVSFLVDSYCCCVCLNMIVLSTWRLQLMPLVTLWRLSILFSFSEESKH
jgi:cystathionine beta-lyase/cystathionine gamma-synthase